jgi:hypothetical protein
MPSILDRAIANPLRFIACRNIDPPPALAWTVSNDRLVVALLTAITAVIWYLVEPIVFTYDSFAYLTAAKFIAGVDGGSFSYFRPPLLPLLLAATGVASRQTYFWFNLTQVALGIASVLLVHDCLRRFSKVIGLIATGFFIITFIGFVYSKSVMTEQIYLFGWCLCINGGLAYLWTGGPSRLVQVVVALLILALARAQGAYVIAIVLPTLAIGQPRRLPAVAVALLAYVLVLFSYGKVHAAMARSIQSATTSIDVSSFGISDSTGKMLFMVPYYDVYRRLGKPIIAAENGPASRRMVAELRAYYLVPEHLAAMTNHQRYNQFAGKPDDFVLAMQREPEGNYWWAIWNALDDRLGAAGSDALLLRVTIEAVIAHPLSTGLVYGGNFLFAFFFADSSYVWQHRPFGPDWIDPKLAKEMQASGDPSVPTVFARILNVLFPVLRCLVVIGAILVAPFAWRSRWRMEFVFCLSLVVYNQATLALAATPESRYTYYIVPPLLIAVTMGLQAYIDWCRVSDATDEAL